MLKVKYKIIFADNKPDKYIKIKLAKSHLKLKSRHDEICHKIEAKVGLFFRGEWLGTELC